MRDGDVGPAPAGAGGDAPGIGEGAPGIRAGAHGMLRSLRGIALVFAALVSCVSPEASRERNGGPGADVGNRSVTRVPSARPQTSDTTLWPGLAPAPVERLARGEIPPPAGVSPAAAPAARGQTPVTPNTPASAAEQSTFDRGRTASPRAPARPPASPP